MVDLRIVHEEVFPCSSLLGKGWWQRKESCQWFLIVQPTWKVGKMRYVRKIPNGLKLVLDAFGRVMESMLRRNPLKSWRANSGRRHPPEFATWSNPWRLRHFADRPSSPSHPELPSLRWIRSGVLFISVQLLFHVPSCIFMLELLRRGTIRQSCSLRSGLSTGRLTRPPWSTGGCSRKTFARA